MTKKEHRRVSPIPENCCAFCGGTPLTNEELFADWMTLEIQKMGGGRKQPFNIISLQETEYSVKPKPTDRPILKVKRFCGKCNNGWMGNYERTVGPILTPAFYGEEVRLTIARQRLIAAWMLKNALVADLSPHPYPPYNALPEYFDYFYRNREPWSNVQVVLARYGGSRISDLWTVGFSHHVRRPIDQEFTRVGRPTPHPGKADGFLTTLQVGQLVVQVLCYPEGETNPFIGPDGKRTVYQRGDLHVPDITIPIWPIRRRQKWPPKKTLNDDGLHQLAGDPHTHKLERGPRTTTPRTKAAHSAHPPSGTG